MARKDKQKVIDDVWTEDHIRTYLAFDPPEGVNRDFHRLQKAYQSMREEDFETFLEMFKASGGDIQARVTGDALELSTRRSARKYSRRTII